MAANNPDLATMIETPRIIAVPAQLTAAIRLTVPRMEIREVMGPGIKEVYATLAAQNIKPAGPWFTHHLQAPSYLFDFEICVPVATPVQAAGRVRPGQLPANGKVACTVFHGDYEHLADGWNEFMQWIKANGHTPATNLWECYVVGPETSADPADWRTGLYRPLNN